MQDWAKVNRVSLLHGCKWANTRSAHNVVREGGISAGRSNCVVNVFWTIVLLCEEPAEPDTI